MYIHKLQYGWLKSSWQPCVLLLAGSSLLTHRLAPPASGETITACCQSLTYSWIHFSTAGSAYRLSTGMSKKPWKRWENMPTMLCVYCIMLHFVHVCHLIHSGKGWCHNLFCFFNLQFKCKIPLQNGNCCYIITWQKFRMSTQIYKSGMRIQSEFWWLYTAPVTVTQQWWSTI